MLTNTLTIDEPTLEEMNFMVKLVMQRRLSFLETGGNIILPDLPLVIMIENVELHQKMMKRLLKMKNLNELTDQQNILRKILLSTNGQEKWD